ncbi:demethylmacrocin O-methyltransferase-like [Paramacrobiotus metropolitanus]|uniref:demethylmacrocin O-methyltransferase-like n=1 Tax=Paramacrobiotus metropolitanus TaxID=2943436 RepID=UPI002445EEB6|nr:demethylmacrocin O-methyltransferase-like [Paramacrobiotus metropolitanus]
MDLLLACKIFTVCALFLFLYYVHFIIQGWSFGSAFPYTLIIQRHPHGVIPDALDVPIPSSFSSKWFDDWFANYSQHAAGIDRWTGYFRAYTHHFHHYRGHPVHFLEIGVQSGGSINMWRDYFGAGLMYYGLDIDQRCRRFTRENVTIFIGDQGNADTLRNFSRQWPPFDIILDDGGHSTQQQLVSFEILFPLVKMGGVYVIEDLHTSYWKEYGGSSERHADTMIERTKMWIDVLNLQHNRNAAFRNNSQNSELHGLMDSLHFYDSMVFIVKNTVLPSNRLRKGGRWIGRK